MHQAKSGQSGFGALVHESSSPENPIVGNYGPAVVVEFVAEQKGRFLLLWAWRGAGESICELSLAPSCPSLKVEDVFATLVQEMAHLGSTSRESSRVHLATTENSGGRSWKRLDCLQLPEGNNGKSRLRVFQTIKRGAFAAAFNEQLPEDVRLPFVSVERAPGAEGEENGTKQGKRAQYECSGECGTTMRDPSVRL